jgi:hypothetical protein
MTDPIEEAFREFQVDTLTDPVKRYTHDDKEIFRAGWVAAQKKPAPALRESVWVAAPIAPEDDPDN